MTTTVAQAIEQSVAQDETVHIEWTAEAAADLAVECDDSAETETVVEYWGTTEDGATWRIHLDRA